VLAGLFGALVLVQYRAEQNDIIDEGLRERYFAVQRALADVPEREALTDITSTLPRGESFAQVVDEHGAVLAASPRALSEDQVLNADEIRDGRRGKSTLVRSVAPTDERARLLVGPADVGGRAVVLVVGTRLAEAEGAFDQLVLALVIGLPLLVGLVSLGGWFLAGAALAPVRAMIEEAEDLSVREPGQRLTVPASGGTEIAELAQRLNEMLARIEAAVAHERGFLDDASHELRTPLAILRGEVELARMSASDGSEQAVALDSVMEEVERLQALTTDLLVLARTRTSTAEVRPEVELGDIAAAAIARVLRAGGDQSIEISARGTAVVRGDAAALERAVTNILENACRFARTKVDVVVGERAGETGQEAWIEVRDDGPGFPPELEGSRTFERFARLDGPGRYSGAGLGLAIVGEILVAHGGVVEAKNAQPGGAVVRIVIPNPDSPGTGDHEP
jgi:two-component system, OmpR family, sensor kinase